MSCVCVSVCECERESEGRPPLFGVGEWAGVVSGTGVEKLETRVRSTPLPFEPQLLSGWGINNGRILKSFVLQFFVF